MSNYETNLKDAALALLAAAKKQHIDFEALATDANSHIMDNGKSAVSALSTGQVQKLVKELIEEAHAR